MSLESIGPSPGKENSMAHSKAIFWTAFIILASSGIYVAHQMDLKQQWIQDTYFNPKPIEWEQPWIREQGLKTQGQEGTEDKSIAAQEEGRPHEAPPDSKGAKSKDSAATENDAASTEGIAAQDSSIAQRTAGQAEIEAYIEIYMNLGMI